MSRKSKKKRGEIILINLAKENPIEIQADTCLYIVPASICIWKKMVHHQDQKFQF